MKNFAGLPAVLKKVRKATGMRQVAVGKHLGVTRKTVGAWETGRTKPDLETLDALMDLYSLSLRDLAIMLEGEAGAEQGGLDAMFDVLADELLKRAEEKAANLADAASEEDS